MEIPQIGEKTSNKQLEALSFFGKDFAQRALQSGEEYTFLKLSFDEPLSLEKHKHAHFLLLKGELQSATDFRKLIDDQVDSRNSAELSFLPGEAFNREDLKQAGFKLVSVAETLIFATSIDLADFKELKTRVARTASILRSAEPKNKQNQSQPATVEAEQKTIHGAIQGFFQERNLLRNLLQSVKDDFHSTKDNLDLDPTNSGKCLERIYQFYNQKPLPVRDESSSHKNIIEFSKDIESLGFITQKHQLSWSKILELKKPFVLVAGSGNFHWITGTKGVFLQEHTGELPAQMSIFDAGFKELYSVLLIEPTVLNEKDDHDTFTFKWYWDLVRANRTLVTQIALVSFASQMPILAIPFLYKNIFKQVLKEGDLSALAVSSVIVFALFVTDFLLRNVGTMLFMKQMLRIDKMAIHTIISRALHAPLSSFTTVHLQTYKDTLYDLLKINSSVLSVALVSSTQTLCTLFPFAVLCFFSWRLGLIVLGFLVLSFVVAQFASRNEKKYFANRDQGEIDTRLGFREALNNIESIKSLNISQEIKWDMMRKIERNQQEQYKQDLVLGRGSIILDLIGNLGTFSILYFGAIEVLSGSMASGIFIAFTWLGRKILKNFQGFCVDAIEFLQAVKSIREFEGKFNSERDTFNQGVKLNETETSSLGQIEFRDVCFRYKSNEPQVLYNLNFSIASGEKILLKGPSGTGKTTIMRLMQKIYRAEAGSVRLAKYEIEYISVDSINEFVGFIPHAPIILSGTMLDNIALVKSNASYQEINAAAIAVGLDQYVEKHTQGLKTELENGGLSLSNGDRARLSLARMILRKPKVLLVDDAFSSLSFSERENIYKVIWTHFKDATCVFASDCPLLAERVDRVIALSSDFDRELGDDGSSFDLIRMQRG